MPRIKVEITHPDRVLFPDDGITKSDLAEYYSSVAAVMLPHLEKRPLTLYRFPGGIGEEGFVQQDFAGSLPHWMGQAKVARLGDGGTVVHPVAERREALVWLANRGCITPHIWLSRRDRPDKPDRLVFDLDPSCDDFAVLRSTARTVADVLDDLGLWCCVQTTGSRGLHVMAPLRAHADFDTARRFARDVAELVAADDPEHRTTEVRKSRRGDRVYLDVMRNAYAQTTVAPYGVRAAWGAPVATPLDWDELSCRGMRSGRFSIRDLPEQIAERGDPWADMRPHARSLSGPMRRLSRRIG